MKTHIFFSLRFLRQALRLFYVIPAILAIFSFVQTGFADGDLDPTYNASATEGFGYVSETAVQPDGKIIAVGIFQRANGTRTNGIARFNANGSLDSSFNAGTGASAVIRAVALQPDGKIIVGGAFTSFNNQAVSRILRLNSDGSIDSSFSLAVAFNNQINDILILSGGKIMVGGQFNLSSTRLARLNSDGTLDTAITGFNNTVFTIALAPDGKILVGGQFSLPKPQVARLNSDGSLDSSFNPATGTNGNSPVYKVVVQPNNKVLAGGFFNTINGASTDGLVRFNEDGTIDTTFEITNDPEFQDIEVNAIALQPDGKILAGFFDNTSASFGDVWRFNSDGSRDATFNTGNSPAVADLNLQADGKVLAGGYFVTINNQQRLRLMKLNSDGTLDNTFNPSVSTYGIVYAIKRQPDGKVLIGGDFEYVNGIKRRAIARLNADGSLDTSFNIGVGFYGDIFAIEVQSDGKIVIGGLFAGDATFPVQAVARINSDGSFAVSLNNSVERLVVVAYALAIQSDGKILVGGSIFNSSFSGFLCASRINPDASLDKAFIPDALPNGTVRAILVQPDNKIIIGGNFFPTGGSGIQRNGIARLTTTGALDSGFAAGGGAVYSLAQQADGKVVAGGVLLRRYAGADGAIDATFNPGAPPNNLIRAMALQPDGKILIGGNFTTYNGLTANRITRVSTDGSLDVSFNPGGAVQAGSVLSLGLQSDNKVLVGGQFLDFNFIEKFSIARLQNTASIIRAPFDFDGDGKTDLSIFRPSVGEWWYLKSSNGGNAAAQFGAGTDTLTPGDFTGDGKTDIAFWRPSTGFWFVLRSEDYSFYSFPFGTTGDVPAPADFDGDGKTDATVFRPSTSTWYISRSSDGGATIQQFGQSGDVPVTADYDGDGKSDIAIYRVAAGEWWIQRSAAGTIAFQFGNSSDKPVQGDYTGDGKSDVAIWRPSTGEWFILRSEDQSYYSFPFGTNGDSPAPGDYDGDGKFDATVFRPSSSTWYVQRTTAGTLIQTFGIAGDRAVPNAFVP